MKQRARSVTEAARNQFQSSLAMLERLAEVCPDPVWVAYHNGLPFWYHAYHTAYFIDYWFREELAGPFRQSMAFDPAIPPEFERVIGPQLMVSREEMKQYLRRIGEKAGQFFDGLDDAKLAEPALDGRRDCTYADVVMTQLRHVMFNLGYLNGILRGLGLEESEWYAYNEED